MMFWGLDHGAEVLRLAGDVIATLPRDLNIVIAGLNAPHAVFVPEQHRDRPSDTLLITGFGSAEAHEQVMARLNKELPPLFQYSTPIPYVALQQMLDESNAWGFHCNQKSTNLAGPLRDRRRGRGTRLVPR
jgi:hypothetical protein